MIQLSKKIALAAALGALLILPTAAKAGFVPVFTGGSGTNTFTYTLNFTTNAAQTETLQVPDFVTLYDFNAGVTAANVVVAGGGFTITTPATGVTPTGILPAQDSAAINNITFTYTGTSINVDTTFNVTITLSGVFTTRVGEYSSADSILAGGDNRQLGSVLVPVPEPASVALLGLGGLGLGLVARRRMARA